jgi:hypothetical protein
LVTPANLRFGIYIVSPCRLSKNVKIKLHKTVILPVVLQRCEAWSQTLKEKYRLGIFENRVLRETFEHKTEAGTEDWENYIMRSFIICNRRHILFG